jgi:hypothetical protein
MKDAPSHLHWMRSPQFKHDQGYSPLGERKDLVAKGECENRMAERVLQLMELGYFQHSREQFAPNLDGCLFAQFGSSEGPGLWVCCDGL